MTGERYIRPRRRPGLHFVEARIVGVKPLSGKVSWTRHATLEDADRAAAQYLGSLAYRRSLPMRQYYRVNIYRKERS